MPAMLEDGSHPPEISISRTSSAGSKNNQNGPKQGDRPAPRVNTNNTWNARRWRPPKHATWGSKPAHSPDVEWHIKWTKDCLYVLYRIYDSSEIDAYYDRSSIGRVLIIDYISSIESAGSGKRHVTVAAQEFQNLRELERFYADSKRVHAAALRVIHVQNATWATRFLLRKFNIDHPSEIVGMQGFSKWAQYEKPRQRNGRPFPHGKSWREQTDPWRRVSRTAFGLVSGSKGGRLSDVAK